MQKLAQLAGVSTRTLRYYDEFGLLRPAKINSSGYRIYGRNELDLLQQILFYRELGFSLDKIREIVTSPSFDRTQALREHRVKLLERKQQLELLLANVDKTLAQSEGRITMSDTEKFAGFKHNKLQENEIKYGREIREKYGDDRVAESNRKWNGMSEEEFNRNQQVEEDMFRTLALAMEDGDPAGELAQKAAELHRQWLSFYWGSYTKEAHAGVVQMYVEDERFTSYYDSHRPGLAEFLRNAVLVYTGMKRMNQKP